VFRNTQLLKNPEAKARTVGLDIVGHVIDQSPASSRFTASAVNQ
jgi:hypothetical protein